MTSLADTARPWRQETGLVGPRAKISWPQSKLSCRQGAINMTITTTLKVGIASLEQYKVRTVAIARG
jgi:hypothetical protein